MAHESKNLQARFLLSALATSLTTTTTTATKAAETSIIPTAVRKTTTLSTSIPPMDNECACSDCNHICKTYSSSSVASLGKLRALSGRKPFIHKEGTCTTCHGGDGAGCPKSDTDWHHPCSICYHDIYVDWVPVQTECCQTLAHPECILAELEEPAHYGHSSLWRACWCGKVYGANGELIDGCMTCGSQDADIIEVLREAMHSQLVPMRRPANKRSVQG